MYKDELRAMVKLKIDEYLNLFKDDIDLPLDTIDFEFYKYEEE